jgi:hypothetical protein
MIDITKPILAGNDIAHSPSGDLCPSCGCNMRNAGMLCFFSGYANSCDGEELQDATITIRLGTHLPHDKGYDLALISKLIGAQFDVGFCSVDCMRQFFQCIFDHIENESESGAEVDSE